MIWNDIKQRVRHWALATATSAQLKVAFVAKEIKTPKGSIQIEAKNLTVQSLEQWISAVSLATDPENPDRSALFDLYDSLKNDNHYGACIDNRILPLQGCKIKMIDESGNENDDLVKLLDRNWFDDLQKTYIETGFEGKTVAELYELTEEGELSHIEVLPISHVHLKKKLILKEPGSDKGFAYSEGKNANYYVEVGSDPLGLLWRMAPALIAKKMGLGFWLDYIDKYGVDSMFITTDREDQDRLDELKEMAENFRSSGFLILRGKEKIDFSNQASANSHENFNALIKLINSELSKRMLGQTGTMDEKSYSGSAEVHQEVSKYRLKADKKRFKRFFNEQIKPRLVALSPVYAAFATHNLDWDETEDMSRKEYVDSVNNLATNFILDTEDVEQKTGLKILGQKGVTETTGETDEKKKSKKP